MIHICVGTNRKFIARWRIPFARKFRCGPERKQQSRALHDMVREWSKARYIEADVIMCADYYDPCRVAHLTRK